MNDKIVRALIEAAAIFAQYDSFWTEEQIKSYVKNSNYKIGVQLAVKLFRDSHDHYQSVSIQKTDIMIGRERDLYSVFLPFCQHLSNNLSKYERMVFYISVMQLYRNIRSFSSSEIEFFTTLAMDLGIDANDSDNLMLLVDYHSEGQILNPHFLIVSNHDNIHTEELEGAWVDKNKPRDAITNYYLNRPNLNGQFIFLKINHFSFFAFVYHGEEKPVLNNKEIFPGKLYILDRTETIQYQDNEKINYQDIRSFFSNEAAEVNLHFVGKEVKSLRRHSKNYHEFIHPFSFSEESGNIVFINGPNPTTSQVVNYLSGISNDYNGEIFLNNYHYKTEFYKILKLLSVVTSSPIYDSNLSIYQNIDLITRLFYYKIDDAKIHKHIEDIIVRFHLSEIRNNSIKETATGEYNGLHHCLLNLACAFISDPHIIFIDTLLENLSSPDTDFVMQILRRESAMGRLIFITNSDLIPSLFKYADKLWIFDDEGYVIYQGAPKEALVHFHSFKRNSESDETSAIIDSDDPTQITQLIHERAVDENGVSKLARKVTPEEWYQYYISKSTEVKNDIAHKKVLPISLVNMANITRQFCLFLTKIVTSKVNQYRSSILFLVLGILLALSIGMIYRYDWGNTYLFGLNPNIHLYFISVIVVLFILNFVKGFTETQKEKLAIGYFSYKSASSISYINALLVCLLLFAIIVSAAFAAIGNVILAIHGSFLKFFLIYFSISLLANILGVMISILKINVFKAYLAFIGFCCFSLIFSGVFIDFRNLPRNFGPRSKVPLIAEFSPFRWAFESLAVDLVKNNKFEKIFYDVDKSLENSYFAANFLIPEIQSQLTNIENQNGLNKIRIIKAIGAEISFFPKIYNGLFPFEYVNELKEDKISPQLISETQDYLTYTQLQFFDHIRDLTEQKKGIENRVRDSVGNENFQKFFLMNNNLSLKNFINGSNAISRIYFDGEEFVKSINPIFLDPTSNYGKAHLFAPVKYYNGYRYESIWFNLLVLSIFILMVYTLLLIASQRPGTLFMKNK